MVSSAPASDPLEQVVFGWSETGLQGRNRLQIVATSEGWSRDNRYRRAALRLCRLDAPGGRDPIAFGWVDLGGRRFVFQRRMVASSTGDARRLVAHVVAGSPADLPVELLLRAFDSKFWWDGSPLGQVLPSATARDLTRGWSRDRQPAASLVSEPLLGRILASGHGSPVAFDGDCRALHAAAWGIHERLPRLLETLSFSTYETGQMVRWFDVVGLDGTPRPRGAQWCSPNATSPRYDARQLADIATVLGAATEQLAARDAEAPKVYREVLRVAERTVARKPEAIPKLLTRDGTLPAVLATDVGVRGVARALWSLDAQKWPKVLVTDDAGYERVSALAQATADLATPDVEMTLGAVARRLNGINPRTAPVYVQRVLERHSKADRLPTPDPDFLAAAAGWVFKTAVPEPIVLALGTWLEQSLSGALLMDRRIPAPWRETLFLAASAEGKLDIEDYGDLAVRHPHLFETPAWLPADPEKVAQLASGPEPLRGLTAQAVVRAWKPRKVVTTAVSLHTKGEAVGTTALLAALGREKSVSLDAREAEAVWRILGELTLASTTGASPVGLLDLPWDVAGHLGSTSEWIGPAAEVMRRGKGNDVGRSRAWVEVIAKSPEQSRTRLCQVALHDLALTSPADWAFRRAVTQVQPGRLDRALQAQVMLTALDRRDEVNESFLPILLYALDAAVVPVGFLRLRVSAGECDELAHRQVARMEEFDPGVFVRIRKDLNRPVARWLKVGRAKRV